MADSESPIDPSGSVFKPSVGGRTTLGLEDRAVDKLISGITKITGAYDKLKIAATGAAKAMGGAAGSVGGSSSAGGTSVSASMASSLGSIPGKAGAAMSSPSKSSMLNKMGGGSGGGSGSLGQDIVGLINAVQKPFSDFSGAVNARVESGAQYSLQADRMSVQLQQMYGMSNKQVRGQLRMPLTSHYLLGGGTAINDLLGMQASTGLSAAKNASTVESLRAVSGFSYGSGDITKMLTTMGSPDVANKMFMMGGTGMYGIGGKQRSGMQSIQDIVRRTGLTNPDALKGALQQGSNTRQRLNAMGVPQDMQDMVIQYAMQNNSFQKKSGNKNVMYDPSVEADRKTMGIEDTYAVAHEKTTGEKLKREERFYDKQTGALSQFEKNLRTSTKLLGAFENALSGVVSAYIGTKGHPITNTVKYGVNYAQNVGQQALQTSINLAAEGAGAIIPGDAVDSVGKTVPAPTPSAGAQDTNVKLSKENERKLATLQPKLAIPLRKMLEAKPELVIGDAVRSEAQQERSFRERYVKTDAPLSEKGESDRIWNGVLWKIKPGEVPMAPPGQSYHQVGLAADVAGDPEWVRANAARFGLDHGGTRKGAQSDEPFHVQPAGTMGTMLKGGTGGSTASKGVTSTGSVSTASVRKTAFRGINSTPKMGGGSSPASINNSASSIKAYIEKGGLKSEGSIIAGTDKISSLSAGAVATAKGGDAVDYRPSLSQGMAPQQSAPAQTSTMSGHQGGVGDITISPNIYLNGSQDMTTDLRRIAREVGALLEQEVKLKMMRTS
jgi:hypothetical protein